MSISWWRVSGCASCLDVGAAETEAFWRESSGAWSRAACSACSLVISDAHPGLKAALAQVLGAPSQQCTVHVLRDLRSHVRKDQHDALDAIIRTIFTAADATGPANDYATRWYTRGIDRFQRRGVPPSGRSGA